MKALAVLGCLALGVAGQRRGGGSSDSSSDSSGDSSGSSSSGGGSSNRGPQHVEVSGDKWPYLWQGSYYNGSITVDTSIDYWPDCSEGSRSTFRTSMSGILLIGPGNFTTSSFDEADPNFLLMGWNEGRRPTNNWTDGMYYGNGGPGLTRWFSTDVKLMLSRFVEVWQDTTRFTQSSSTHPWDHGWTVDADPLGNGNYSINGTFRDLSQTFSHHDNSANNWIYLTTTLCNNASVVDEYKMQPWPYKDAVRDWPTQQNTTFLGTFSDQRASVVWSGNYWAGFNSIDYGVPFNKDGYPQGHFSVRFDGVIDAFNSDRLVPRPNSTDFATRLAVGGPDWVDTQRDREDNLPTRRVYYGAAAATRGSLWISAGAALFALALVW